MAKITPFGVGQILVEEGVLTKDQVNHCSRFVFDCPANGQPQLYLQLDADENVIRKLSPMLKGMINDDEG